MSAAQPSRHLGCFDVREHEHEDVRSRVEQVRGTHTVPVMVSVLPLVGVHIDPGTAAWIITVGAAILGPAAVTASTPNTWKDDGKVNENRASAL
ncbi:hypothetical protein GCM10023192_11270 [Amycolatopsis samaneae]